MVANNGGRGLRIVATKSTCNGYDKSDDNNTKAKKMKIGNVMLISTTIEMEDLLCIQKFV